MDTGTSFVPSDFCAGTSRMDTENRQANLALADLVRSWAARKNAATGQIALAWLLAQRPCIAPLPGTTQMPHMLEP